MSVAIHFSHQGLPRPSRAAFTPETIVAALLAAGAAWAPVFFGASGTWPRFCLELSMGAAAILWASAGPRPRRLTAIPLLVAGSLLLQLVPLPDWLLVMLAPVSAGAWKVASAGMPGVSARISVDPAATWAGIRTIFVAIATTVAVVGLARQQQSRRLLLGGMGVSGLLIFLFAAVWGRVGEDRIMLGFLDLTGPLLPSQSPLILHAQSNGVGVSEWVMLDGQRYRADSGWIGGCVGTFFYANHLAAAVCLTLPVILSWWLWLTAERLPPWGRWAIVGATAMTGIWVVASLANSRAGAGALALTLATFLALVAPARWLRSVCGVAAAGLAACIAGFLILIFLPRDSVLTIVPTDFRKQAADTLVAGRSDPAHVAIRAFAASPLLGTGLDTFQDVFPRFYAGRHTLFYAHNEYAQLLAETGLLGAILLAALVTMLVPKAVRFWRDAPGHYRVLNAGPWAALVGIAAHSAFDWNFHLPAIGLLTAIVLGLAVSSVPGRKPDEGRAPWIPESVPRWSLVACCIITIGGLWRDAISETGQRQLREAIVADRLAAKDPKHADATEPLSQAIFAGESLARFDPGDADLLVTLGQAHLHLARLAPPGQARNLLLGNAERWFQRARQASAMCRGLPEPAVNDRSTEGSNPNGRN